MTTNAAPTQSPPATSARSSWLGNVWRRLIEPPVSLPEPERRRARLLAALLLFFFLFVVISISAAFVFDPAHTAFNTPTTSVAAVIVIFVALAYFLNRTGRYTLATVLTVAVISLGLWVAIIADRHDPDAVHELLPYITICVLLSSLLLPARVTALVAGMHILVSLLVPTFVPQLTTADRVNSLIFVGFALALIVVIAALRERDRTYIGRQNEYLAALHETTLALMNRLDLEDLLQAIVSRAAHLMGTSHGYLYLIESSEMEMEARVGIGLFSHYRGVRLKPGEGLAGKIWQSGQSLVVDDYDAWSGRSPQFAESATRAAIGVPLTSAGQVVGVIGMALTETSRTFGEVEIALLGRFAQLASVALDNARLYRAAQRQLDERKRTEEVLAQERYLLHALMDNTPDSIYFKDAKSRFTRVSRALAQRIGLSDPSRVIGRTDDDFFPEELAREWRAEEQELMRSGQPIVGKEEKENLPGGREAWVLTTKLPLPDSEGNIIGIVGISTDITQHKLAEQAVHQRNEALTTLNQFGQALNQLAAPVEILELIYTIIGHVLSNDNLYIALYDEAQRQISFPVYTIDGQKREPLARPFGNGLTEYVIGTRTSLLLSRDVSAALIERGIADIGRPARSLLAVPMMIGSKAIGVITVQDYEREDAYNSGHAELLATIAAQTATALENTRLYRAAQQEIEERKQAEAALRGAEARYRTLVEQLPAITYVMEFGERPRTTYISPQVERLLGFSPAEWLADSELWIKQLYPDDRERVLAGVRRADAEGKPLDLEYRVLARDGRVLWIRNQSVVIRDEAGELRYIHGVMFDITERKQVEVELAQERNLLRTLIDNVPDFIYTKDAASRFRLANRAAATSLGLTPEAVVGKTDFDLHPPELAAHYFADEQAVLQSDRPLIDREELVIIGRQERWMLTTTVPLHDNTGRVTGLVGIARDITERQQAAQALQAVNEKLTRSLAELEARTRQISLLNEMGDLLQACLTVEEAYTAIGRMVRQLFPDEAGALYVTSASRNLVEAVVHWGAAPPKTQVFAPEECWALRRGRLYLVEGISTSASAHLHDSALLCSHLQSPWPSAYLCLPLVAQSEASGVLHLQYLGADGALREAAHRHFDETKQQLARTVADSIALALANLNLRETLRHQSIRDSLTGLFNRRYMEESLERELLRVTRVKAPLSVVMLDIDHFKRFNDTYGHSAGDRLLREMGVFLQAHVRGEDIACRYGGEEFTLIMPGASLEVTRARAVHLQEDVKHLHLQHEGQPLGPITLSLGVAMFPNCGPTAEAVLRAADAALYHAKREGRDRVVIAQ